MIRPEIALASAAVTAIAALAACSADSTTAAPSRSTPSTEASTDTSTDGATGPIDLKPIPAGDALEPGRYAVPFFGDDGPARALVDVPAGYFSAGGWVIDDGHGTLAPEEFGDLLFLAGDLGRVDTWLDRAANERGTMMSLQVLSHALRVLVMYQQFAKAGDPAAKAIPSREYTSRMNLGVRELRRRIESW